MRDAQKVIYVASPTEKLDALARRLQAIAAETADGADQIHELYQRLRALVAEWRAADVHPEHQSGLRIAADQLEALLAERT